MAENAGLENHRIKSFKNKGRDVEVSWHTNARLNEMNRGSFPVENVSLWASFGSPAAAAR